MSTKALKVAGILGVCVVLAVATTVAFAGDKGNMEAKTVTLEGEVLDLYCFMMHPEDGQGPDHAKCARACMNKGLPIGYLVDGKVYVIIGKDHDPVAEIVAPFVGMPSRLTGKLMEHNGVLALELVSIEAVEDDQG